MAALTRDQVKEIVKKALEKVSGPIVGDIEEIPNQDFKAMNDLLITKFLDYLKKFVKEHDYYNRQREVTEGKHYDVALSKQTFNGWDSVTDCINYIYDNHYEEFNNQQ